MIKERQYCHYPYFVHPESPPHNQYHNLHHSFSIPGGDLEQGLRLITSNDDVTYMCELHAEWPTNEITLYVEPETEPIAIEKPMVEPDQPIAVDQLWKMNDEDYDTDCEEVTLVMGEQSRGSDNIVSL